MREAKQIKVYKRGDVILDTYLVEDIRSGGMGNVYIADHKKWKLKVAIKAPNEKILSDKGLFNRVLKEADAWIDLGLHPNIAYCYYVRSLDEVPHIFIEYVNGGNLREWIADGKCYDLKVGLDQAIQFCHGMEQAHNHGMIHRDIKPANILMTSEGTLKITDFGLVKTSGLDTPYAGVQGGSRGDTLFAQAMGTLAYMSPEQYETPLDVDRRTDIYAFGVCMYEMFCGTMPYDQTSADLPAAYIAKLARKTRHEPSQLRHDIPDDLADILKKCVSLERGDRYSSFEELRTSLTLLYVRLFDEYPLQADIKTSMANAYRLMIKTGGTAGEFIRVIVKQFGANIKLQLLRFMKDVRDGIISIDKEQQPMGLRADGLNNRGVSYLDLGREEDAIKCWEAAVKDDSAHFESTYNYGYLKWNKGQMTQSEFLRSLERCAGLAGNREEYLVTLAWLYLEMGYIDEVERMGLTDAVEPTSAFAGIPDAWFEERERTVGKAFEGHANTVTSIAITRDGKRILSGSHDKTLKLWDLSGHAIRTFAGHDGAIFSVTFTPDGKFALSASEDNTIRLWEVDSGDEIRKLSGHSETVTSISVTPDGRFAVSGGLDSKIKLWEIATGDAVRTFTGHADAVSAVAVTPDGRAALSGGIDNMLRLWDLRSGKEIIAFSGHKEPVTSVAITPDGEYAISGSEDKTIRLWEITTGKEVRALYGHRYSIEAVAISPNGTYAVSCGKDEILKLWNLRTGQEVRTLWYPAATAYCAAITPDGLYALYGTDDGHMNLWSLMERPIWRAVADNYLYPLLASAALV